MMLDPARLPAQRILVVAPHPDDESLGCGGLIAALGRAGRRFHTVFVTDGGASHPRSRRWPRRDLAALREAEAIEALGRLGVGDHPRTFLRLADAAMPRAGSPDGAAARSAVAAVVRSFRPDLVVLPWRRDPHRDHRDSWRLTVEALEATGHRPRRLEYAIWLSELGQAEDAPRAGEVDAVTLDIAAVVPVKRSAVRAHRSQTTGLISDDPDGFRLSERTIGRLTGPHEPYWASHW